MIRSAFRLSFVPFAFVLALATLGPGRAGAQQTEELPADGHNALTDEMTVKWAPCGPSCCAAWRSPTPTAPSTRRRSTRPPAGRLTA